MNLGSNEIIHGDKFQQFCDVCVNEQNLTIDYEKLVKQDCVIFCKTDFIPQLFEVLYCIKDRNYILITHNSDYPIDEIRYYGKPASIKRWYALNVEVEKPDLIPIPSGMERPLGCGYSSDDSVLLKRLQQKREYHNLVYMNYNENNNLQERKNVTEYFKEKSWVTYKQHGISFPDYIDNCYNHKFVVSPPGNGIDCHRTWETLYLGGIPIVKSSVLIDSFRSLPMLIVEDYEILTEELLNIIWNEFQERDFDYSKMTLTYWKNRIAQDKQYYLTDGGV